MALEFASVRVVRANEGVSARRDVSQTRAAPGAEKRPGRSIYVAWVNYQRRAESMQAYFGYDLFYVSAKHLSPAWKFLSYLLRAKTTLQIIHKERPDVVWLQLPPTFLMHLLILYRFVTRRKMKLVADCHNAALRAPWIGVPLTSRLLNRANLVLVHNPDVVTAAHGFGVRDRGLRVLGDCVPTLPPEEAAKEPHAKPTIVMPCSFHPDEPIEAVLQAARQLESATFVITGNHLRLKDRSLVERASANVVFPGFMPLREFDQLLLRASAVLCLTTQDGIQLSAVSEAIGAGRPMIISDTKLLRDLFGPAGIFVDNSAASILQGCRTALAREGEYAAAARTMRTRRIEHWLTEAEPVRVRLASANRAD
jgi:glycosyltransferase involved in cell wall biosynthesis